MNMIGDSICLMRSTALTPLSETKPGLMRSLDEGKKELV